MGYTIMNEKLRYKFKNSDNAARRDVLTFEAYLRGEITKAQAIYELETHNGQYMTPEQFDYYLVNLGYTL